MTSPLDTVTGASIIAGLLLLLRTCRSRQPADGHLHCRLCRYDLFGLPDDHATCPECGADLRRRGAVDHRLHSLRPFSLGFGVMLLALGGFLLVPSIRSRIKVFDPTPYKPAWWLAHDLADKDRARLAADELLQRLRKGSLESPQAIVRRIMSIQGDSSAPWTAAAGDFIVDARQRDFVSDGEWEQFLRRSFTLQPQGTMTRLEMPPIGVVAGRGPSPYALSFVVQRAAWQIKGSPAVQRLDHPLSARPDGRVPGRLLLPSVFPSHSAAELHDKSRTLVITLQCDLTASPTGPSTGTRFGSLSFAGTFQFEVGANIPESAKRPTTLPGDDRWFDTIRIQSNEPLHLKPAITIQDGRPVFILTADAPPADVAMLVVLVDAQGNRWPLTALVAPKGEPMASLLFGARTLGTDWTGFARKPANVRLEYNDFLAANSALSGPFIDRTYESLPVQVQAELEEPTVSTTGRR